MRTIGAALLILTLAILVKSAPDPTTVQGHIATCPNCSDPESNPLRCKTAREITRRAHERNTNRPATATK